MPRGENLNAPKPASVPEDVHEHGDQEEHVRPGREDEHGHEHGHIEPFDLIRIGVTAVVAALVWFRVWEPFPHVSLIGIVGVSIRWMADLP